MGLFGAKLIWWSAGGDLCPCCYRIREEFVHFGLGAAFDPGPGLCTYCWRRGHRYSGRCVPDGEFIAGKHPNETVKVNGRNYLWGQVLEAALEDDLSLAEVEEGLPVDWLSRRFPTPKGFFARLGAVLGGPERITLARRLPQPGLWRASFKLAEIKRGAQEAEKRLADLEQRVAAHEARA